MTQKIVASNVHKAPMGNYYYMKQATKILAS